MSQNELKPRTLSSGVVAGPGSGSGESPGNSGCNCSSSNMNRITTSQSWSHSQVGSSAHNGTELTIGHHQPSARGDFDARTSPGIGDEVGVSQTPQSSSSSQTGASLKEHDLLGMSEVCSSIATRLEDSAVQSNCGYGGDVDLDLNLGCHQEVPHKQHGDSLRNMEHGDGGTGGCVYGSGLDAGSLAVGRRSSTADLGPRLDDYQRQQPIARRNFTYSPLTNVEESDRAAIDSGAMPRWHGGSGVDRRMPSTEELRLQSGRSIEMSAHQDDIIDRKRSLGCLDGPFQEAMPGPGQAQGASDGARRQLLGSRYQDRPWQSFSQDAKASAMTGRELNAGERGEVSDRQQNMGFGVESGETLGWARQQHQLESRYMADWGSNVPIAGIRSLKHPDYFVPASHKPWQSQRLMPRDDFSTHFGGQEVESGRNVHPGSLSDTVGVGYVGGRVPFNLHSKSGIVTGTKRSFDTAVMVPDAHNFPSSAGGNCTAMTMSNPGSSEADAKSKAEQQQQPPLYPSWSSKTSPNSWQALQGNGGSIAPFPYHQGVPGSKGTDAPTDVGVTGDPPRRPWDIHGKGSQDLALLGSKSLKEVNSGGAAPPSSSPATEVTSPPPRAEPKVGWPPLSKSRKEAKPAPPAESMRKPCPAPSPPPQASSPASVASQPDKSRVKVYMDGFHIGRTVDLKASTLYDYETLSVVLEDMFNSILRSNGQDESVRSSNRGRFLHGSEYVLTYEDREGDLMLVGDVPWPLFIENVKRLRIMKGSEADGLGSRAAEKNNKSRPTL